MQMILKQEASLVLKSHSRLQQIPSLYDMRKRSRLVRTVSAGVAAAPAVPHLTVGACEPWRAAAAVPTSIVLIAGSSIKARAICTLHGADLTVLPVEALRARTRVIVHQILEEKQCEEVMK